MARSRTRSSGSRGGGSRMRAGRDMGMLALALWLILAGLTALFGLGAAGLGTATAVLALVAGFLILVQR